MIVISKFKWKEIYKFIAILQCLELTIAFIRLDTMAKIKEEPIRRNQSCTPKLKTCGSETGGSSDSFVKLVGLELKTYEPETG